MYGAREAIVGAGRWSMVMFEQLAAVEFEPTRRFRVSACGAANPGWSKSAHLDAGIMTPRDTLSSKVISTGNQHAMQASVNMYARWQSLVRHL